MSDTEREALCARIDELCAEVERLRRENHKLRRVRDELDFQIHDNWRLTAENSKLQADNERLTETLRGAEREADRLTHEAAELLTENAKLQKVCKEMHDHIKNSCDICDEYYCSSWDEDNECCVFDSYMRELGVEVD